MRQGAVEALGRLPPEELATHAPALRRVAASDGHDQVQEAATKVLAKLPELETMEKDQVGRDAVKAA